MGKQTTAHKPRSFAAKFDAALKSQEIGVRTVARRIVDKQGVPRDTDRLKRIDNVRRQLNTYRGPSPVEPRDASRHQIEDALELERDELKPDEDEEGDRPVRLTIPVTFEISDDQVDRALSRALQARLAAREAFETEPQGA